MRTVQVGAKISRWQHLQAVEKTEDPIVLGKSAGRSHVSVFEFVFKVL